MVGYKDPPKLKITAKALGSRRRPKSGTPYHAEVEWFRVTAWEQGCSVGAVLCPGRAQTQAMGGYICCVWVSCYFPNTWERGQDQRGTMERKIEESFPFYLLSKHHHYQFLSYYLRFHLIGDKWNFETLKADIVTFLVLIILIYIKLGS